MTQQVVGILVIRRRCRCTCGTTKYSIKHLRLRCVLSSKTNLLDLFNMLWHSVGGSI